MGFLASFGMFIGGLGLFFLGVGILWWVSLQNREAERRAAAE